MNIVADARPIGSLIIGAEHLHFRPQPKRGLDGDLDKVGRPFGRLAGSPERIGSRDVEVAQNAVAQAVGNPCILQQRRRSGMQGRGWGGGCYGGGR